MHIQITFFHINEEQKEIIIASLQETADGFEEDENSLKAYFKIENYNAEQIEELAKNRNLSFEKTDIPTQNWNALWESNFDPVIVDDFVAIRAAFHQSIPNVLQEIIITPKMSFGTGHHATTYLMMQQMRKISFVQKSVFDFGTGTGVLAILAKKLGATSITASDIDIWSIDNANENFEMNQCTNIEIVHSDSSQMNKGFDIILANINRNVLLDTIASLSIQLKETGNLILSGILEEDAKAITDCCLNNNLTFIEKTSKDKWICLHFKK